MANPDGIEAGANARRGLRFRGTWDMLATAWSRPPAARFGRIDAIDGLRGLAVAGMVIFHGGWDAAWVGLLPGPGRNVAPGWQAFGDGIAALFLILSGVGLVLAQRRGAKTWSVCRRLAVLAAAAGAITALSFAFLPDQTIAFGILHCMLVGNVVALALMRQPPAVPLALAAVMLALPQMPPPAFVQGPAWGWLGLGAWRPDTLDYRPILPWSGFVLIGLAAGRWIPDRLWLRLPSPPRWLVWSGRRSLAIYLIHQAILFPAAVALALLLGRDPQIRGRDAWRTQFEAQCRADCGESGATPALCGSVCRCAGTRLRESLRSDPSGGGSNLAALAKECFGAAPAETLH